jgi:hypothetical protein
MYTADDWENDPFLEPNPEREARVKKESFETMMSLGIDPAQIKDEEVRRAYTAYTEVR